MGQTTPSSGRSKSAIGCELGLALLLSSLGASCAEIEASEPPPDVILVCWDTVRADHLGFHGYDARPTTPFLDELAAEGTVYEKAFAAASWTKPSVPSYLTGTYPAHHGVYEGSARMRLGTVTDVLGENAVTLAEVFRDRGYRTAAFVKNAQLRLGNGFEQGFELYVDEAGDAEEIRWRALDWLRDDDERPFFLYLHYLDAHWPYPVPESAARRFVDGEVVDSFRGRGGKDLLDRINDGEEPLTEERREALVGLYDGSIRYLDDQTRELFGWLERLGIADSTVFCFVSDHGEEFGEHGKVGHGHGLYEGLLHVPWLIRAPGQVARRIAAQVSLVDMFPTLLEAAGIPLPGSAQGRSRWGADVASDSILAEHKAPDRYEQGLRTSSVEFVREVRAPVRSATESLRLPIRVGERWEAELEWDGDRLVATQLKPRADEDPEDAPEIKGRFEQRGEETYVDGIRFRSVSSTQYVPASDSASDEPRDGGWIKVRGRWSDGVFVAERVKVYEAGTDADFEVRGTVARVPAESRGSIVIAGFDVAIDGGTEWKSVDSRRRAKELSREDVYRFLREGAQAVSERGFRLDSRLRWLGSGSPAEGLADTLGSALDERFSGIVGDEASLGERRVLDEETLSRLRSLGYLR